MKDIWIYCLFQEKDQIKIEIRIKRNTIESVSYSMYYAILEQLFSPKRSLKERCFSYEHLFRKTLSFISNLSIEIFTINFQTHFRRNPFRFRQCSLIFIQF